MSFESISRDNSKFLVFKPWWDEGIVHGFGGKKLAVPRTHGTIESPTLLAAVGCSSLFVPKQVHGNGIFIFKDKVFPKGEIESDGIIVSVEKQTRGERYAVGIYTADCLPIIIRCGKWFGLVHAGWRGVAAGIIAECITAIGKSDESPRWEMVIGPAAGPGRYEVGQEVIDQIGSDAVFERLSSGKYLLSLAGSASNQAERILGVKVGVFDCEVCTIEDNNFHSFRREGERAGRNLCFLQC